MPGPVKIYERPERTGPPPAILAVIALVAIIAGYFLFRAFYHPAAQQHSRASVIYVQTAFWQEGKIDGKPERSASYR